MTHWFGPSADSVLLHNSWIDPVVTFSHIRNLVFFSKWYLQGWYGMISKCWNTVLVSMLVTVCSEWVLLCVIYEIQTTKRQHNYSTIQYNTHIQYGISFCPPPIAKSCSSPLPCVHLHVPGGRVICARYPRQILRVMVLARIHVRDGAFLKQQSTQSDQQQTQQ